MGAALLMWGGTAAPATAAQPQWTIAPSAGAGTRPATDDGRPYIYAEGTPGTVLEDKVAVTNPTKKPLRVTLRGADADNRTDGTLDLRNKAKDTGAWITFAEKNVKIPARTRAEVPFTVTVPAGATPGDHPGAIVASGGGRDAGVSVRLRVGGPTLAALTVEHVRVKDGDSIAYDVVNRGNTTLTPRLAVRADGVFGSVLDRRARTLPVELLPGRRVTLTEPWPGAPALDSVDVKVTVTAGGGAADSATTTARFVPWGVLGGALAVLAGAGCAAYWYVRTHRDRRDRGGTT
ncbi:MULTISPECIES: hypothetical protein [unclassified Streptomyces]|uniref:hypothetical protein n=1 Tax=unclassified Streptomyces TaxID=2593676 RepID=UPI000DB9CFC7|nr:MULTISPECIES: hypothetical protein [unclassified Streptomyces]MYT72561.1 hypothetical protein [Streptomyces sp. SID8367]RAJ79418.1 hypothetical protein K377_05136 [Streptomyces sp. PsTaAH-137]